MSIADQITRLNNAKAAIMDSISNKGVDVPGDALLDELPALIDSIEVGSSEGGDPLYETMWNAITNNNTDYQYLFHKYDGTELDVSKLDTSNVTKMAYMFSYCTQVSELDVSGFDTSNVVEMQYMFNHCSNLISIGDSSNFDTSNVTRMDYMFGYCGNLDALDVGNFDTSNVNTMYGIFMDCTSLIELDISNFDTSNVTNMSYMFNNCKALEELSINNFDMTKVTSTNNMFRYCTSLHIIRLDNCSNDTINKIITSSGFPTDAIEGVTRTIYCKEENAADLTAPTNWVFSFITEEEIIPPTIVPETPSEPEIILTLYEPYEFKNDTSLTEVTTTVNESHTDLSDMFYGCINLTSVNTTDWNTENVTTMSSMFNNCQSLTSLDLSSFNTSNVTSMAKMFAYCYNLEELDIRNFEISQETAIGSMFNSCSNLKVLYLNDCSATTIARLLEGGVVPTRENDDGVMYVNEDTYQTAKNLVPDGWTVFTE